MRFTFGSSTYVMGHVGVRRDRFEQVAILECSGCRERVVVIEEKWLDDSGRKIRPYDPV